MKVYCDASGKLHSICYVLPDIPKVVVRQKSKKKTHNELEYLAILEVLIDYPDTDMDIYCDNMIVVNQLTMEYHIKNSRLRNIALLIWDLCNNRKISFNWIKRDNNMAGKVLG